MLKEKDFNPFGWDIFEMSPKLFTEAIIKFAEKHQEKRAAKQEATTDKLINLLKDF